LNDDCVDVAARSVEGIKTQVNAAVSVEPGEIESLGQIDLGKLPADNDAAIALQREGERRRVVDPVTETKGLIDTAICVQPANAVVGEPIEAGEAARHNNAAIRLKDSRGNFASRPCTRIEAGVERAIKVEACDSIAQDTVGEREPASGNDFPVGLRDDDVYRVVCPRRGDESGVELIDLERGEPVAARDRLAGLLDDLSAVASRLGAEQGLSRAARLVELSGSARQREVASRAGLPGLVEWLADRTERLDG